MKTILTLLFSCLFIIQTAFGQVVTMDEAGLETLITHDSIQITTLREAVENRVILYEYNPLASQAAFWYVTVYRGNGDVINLDITQACDYPTPSHSHYGETRQIMMEVGRLHPGDVIEYEIHEKRLHAPSQAEYQSLSKAWTLHEDGSQEYRYTQELKIQKHSPLNNPYGESHIIYNPDYQEVKIHAAYTKRKNGKIIHVPETSFVEILPAYASKAPAYNQLRERIIQYSSMEDGATIYLDYSILTKPNYYPALDINESLQAALPVKAYDISITVPSDYPLSWQLLGNDNAPASEITADGKKIIHWSLPDTEGISQLVASSYGSTEEALRTLFQQFQESGHFESDTFGAYITEDASTEEEKAAIILNHVVNNLDYCPIPPRDTGYAIRDVDLALRTAYGTLAEKTWLLCVLLNAADIAAEVVAVFPSHLNPEACGLSAIQDLLVKATIEGEERYLSAIRLRPAQINDDTSDRVVSIGDVKKSQKIHDLRH